MNGFIEMTMHFREILMIAARVALLVGPLTFAILTLHTAIVYRTPAHADYRVGLASGSFSGE